MILLDSSNYSGENEILFVKIGPRVLDLWLNTSSGTNPSSKNIFSMPQTPEISYFHWIYLVILEKIKSCS